MFEKRTTEKIFEFKTLLITQSVTKFALHVAIKAKLFTWSLLLKVKVSEV